MLSAKQSNYNFWLINAASYVTLFVVTLQVFRDMPTASTGFWAVFFFACFGVGLALFLRLLDRPRLIHVYLAVQTLFTLAVYFIAPAGALEVQTLYFILSAQAMLALPFWQGIYWIVILSGVTFFGAINARGWGLFLGALAASGGYLFFALFGASLKQAEKAKEQSQALLIDLHKANAQLKAYAVQAKQLAVSEERNRIAREVHDSLGHRLTVAVVQLEGAKRLVHAEPDKSATMIDSMRTELKEGLADLRLSVKSLRQDAAEPLQAALASLAQQFELATGTTVHLNLEDVPQLSEPSYHALFRVAQEGLTNVQKHADAQNIRLNLIEEDTDVALSVVDDGNGLNQALSADGYGIQGLKERAAALSADLKLIELEEGGSKLTMRIPKEQAYV